MSQLKTNPQRKSALQKSLRETHNDIKRHLITTYLDGCRNVLDMGFGRGGDLPKYKLVESIRSIVGIDPDQASLDESCKRAKGLGMDGMLTLYNGSTNVVPIDDIYDAVVCNFALQYFHGFEHHMVEFFKTIGKVTRTGGKFICIVPDAIKVLKAAHPTYKDREGNVIHFEDHGKPIGRGGYNERVGFHVDGPFYEGKMKTEPLCYVDNIVGIARFAGFEPLARGDVSQDVTIMSHVYTWMVFTRA